MHEDSPPPFIVIRTPARLQPDVYDRALELVGCVQTLLDHTTARFHLKNRLDRAVTALVFEMSKARQQPNRIRWRHYRIAHDHASDCATILDILTHQRAAPAADLAAARVVVDDLLAALSTLG